MPRPKGSKGVYADLTQQEHDRYSTWARENHTKMGEMAKAGMGLLASIRPASLARVMMVQDEDVGALMEAMRRLWIKLVHEAPERASQAPFPEPGLSGRRSAETLVKEADAQAPARARPRKRRRTGKESG